MRSPTGRIAWTAQTEAMFRDIFGPRVRGVPRVERNGRQRDGVGHDVAAGRVRAVHEMGAHRRRRDRRTRASPRRQDRATVDAPDAKLVPDQIVALGHLQGDMHHAQPGVVSITQSTELGTVYTRRRGGRVVRRRAPSRHARAHGRRPPGQRHGGARRHGGGNPLVHGRRRCRRAQLRWHQGRAGRRRGRRSSSIRRWPSAPSTSASRSPSCRRRCGSSPPSSTRCSTATCGSAWPQHSNAMGAQLYRLTSEIAAVQHPRVPRPSTACSRSLPREAIEPLQEWCFFWDWDVERSQVRWMTAWDTTARRRRAVRGRRAPSPAVIESREFPCHLQLTTRRRRFSLAVLTGLGAPGGGAAAKQYRNVRTRGFTWPRWRSSSIECSQTIAG